MATIRFDKDHRLEVNESAADIRQAIIGCGAVFNPLIEVTKTGTEERLWVNGSQIREISDKAEPSKQAHFR